MKKSLLFFLLFSPVFLWSQNFNSQKLDSLLDRIDAAEKAMFSLAIHQE
ncbi:MAG: hypothetical protein ABGW76_14585 [Mesonia sp.]